MKYWKYADPIEPARWVSREEAEAIVAIDSSLIVEIDEGSSLYRPFLLASLL